jgi:hypothetical protein
MKTSEQGLPRKKISRKELEMYLELLTRLQNTAARLKAHFLSGGGRERFDCRQGLTLVMGGKGDHPYLAVSLDHLTKIQIQDLLKAGKLTDELLFLYELAHLPFADAYQMHLHDPNVYIIDRVAISLAGFFNVYDKKKWRGKKPMLQEKAKAWRALADCEQFYAELTARQAR